MALRELALFAGAGGGILGGKLLGWNTVGAVEIEKHPRDVLLARQKDGHINRFPIWDDITTFNGRPWRGAVDIISGGFPCQDISVAGTGTGITGKRSGLWGEMARVVREVSPRLVFVENSPMLTTRGLYRVLGDLAEMGYDARWCVLGADDAGAWHRRKRIWILAYSSGCADSTIGRQERKTDSLPEKCREKGYPGGIIRTGDDSEILADSNEMRGLQQKRIIKEQRGRTGDSCKNVADSDQNNVQRELGRINDPEEWENQGKRQAGFCRGKGDWGETESGLGRVADGMASRSHRLKAIGNGQVPAVAALAFTILSEGLI